MVYMSDEEFKKEHTRLPKVLRSGSKQTREKEAADQEDELKAQEAKMAGKEGNEEGKEAKKGAGIRRVEIEPAESGGFVVRVMHKPPEGKKGDMMVHMDEPDLHVCANTQQLSEFLSGAFPTPGSRSKKGKSTSKEKGGSRIDTYEAGDGDEVGY